MSVTTRWGFASTVKQPLRLSTASQWFRPLSLACRPRPRQIPRVPQKIERTFATSIRLAQSLSQATVQEDESQHQDQLEELSPSETYSKHSQPALQNGARITKFRELGERNLVSPKIVDNLTGLMGLETMTEVQSLTIGESLKGVDILAQARTGTGKTLAFLIPLVQNILNHEPSLAQRSRDTHPRADDAKALIVSPTRELAEQIAEAARRLVANTNIKVQTAVGGTQKRLYLRKMQDEGCHILVGTPGRLLDVLTDPTSGVRLPHLNTFVLDEADRLLDDGFYPDIQEIRTHLPPMDKVDRQTLLYTATVPVAVKGMVRDTLKRDYKMIKTIKEGELPTHEKVPQKVVSVRAYQNVLPALVELCTRALSQSDEKPFKAIVFFSATAEAILSHEIFNYLRRGISSDSPLNNTRIIQMHAKLTQAHRTRAAEGFRTATSAILLSSDVTARGMDFPNVTHVIQVGLPPTEEQYVHRLGRTARADKSGEGWLIISAHEAREARFRLGKMPLQVDRSLETATVDMTEQSQVPGHVAKILTEVGDACRRVSYKYKAAAYKATLGMMNYMSSQQQAVDTLNERAVFGWGMEKPPKVPPKFAARLGLTSIRGLEVGYDDELDEGGPGSRLQNPRFGNKFDRNGHRERPQRPRFDDGSDGYGYRQRPQSSPFESAGPQSENLTVRRPDFNKRRSNY